MVMVFQKLFSKQINSITIAAILVAGSSMASRLLGVVRDHILARQFGAGDLLDVYYAAFRIPDFMYNLLILGALSAGFVPILTGLIKDISCEKKFPWQNNDSAWRLVNNLLSIIGLGLIGLSVLGYMFAPALMGVIAPGFSEEKKLLTIDMTRIMMLSPLFLGFSSIFSGILQSFKRFFIYSFSPIFYNLGIIIGALYLTPSCGAYGLAYGVVLGAFLHMAIQIPVVFHLGYKYRPILDWQNKETRKIGKMMLPRMMSLGISQVSIFVMTVIASTLSSGSLAIFNFANNLQSFPIGIFGVSFAVAAFPSLSQNAFNHKKLAENFSDVFRQVMFFIIPSTVLIYVLRAHLIRIILGAGKFDWTDTILTLNTLGFFVISLFAQALLPLLTRVFYARHNSRTPFYVGIVSEVVNIASALILSRSMGVAGLALAFSISSITNFILLWLVLRLEVGHLDEERILSSVFKFSLAAVAAGVVAQGMKLLVWSFVDMQKVWGVAVQGGVAGLFGTLVYAAFCSLLKSEEYIYFFKAFKRRLSFKKVEAGDQSEARGI